MKPGNKKKLPPHIASNQQETARAGYHKKSFDTFPQTQILEP
jgi:hypothetical protein